MTTAPGTVNLGADHSEGLVGLDADRPREWPDEAGPAGAALELVVRREQRLTTPGAEEGPGALLPVQGAGEGALGAGFAVAKVGAAAIGALAEKPELFSRLLIFVGLAEGIAIYGLIVSILILNRLT